MASKRKTWEFDVLEKMATVHGMVVEVSPTAMSRCYPDKQYFSGKVSDGQKVVRMVSFEPKLRAAMDKLREEGKAVAIVNCCVQERRFDNLEIVASLKTRLESSPKRFKLSDKLLDQAGCSFAVDATLDGLEMIVDKQWINVMVKIIKMGEPTLVSAKFGPLKKQDCIIGDSNGRARVVLWEKKIDSMKEGRSYRLTRVSVQEFGEVKYLSLPLDATFEEIDDIGDMADSDEDSEPAGGQPVSKAEIAAVLEVDEYNSCLSCNPLKANFI